MADEKINAAKNRIKRTSSEAEIRRAEEAVRYYSKFAATKDAVQEGMKLLEKERALNLTNIKDSCKFELQRFINMRGTIDKTTGTIHLPLMTISDQNPDSTMKKISAANDLITRIEAANSLDELNDTLQNASSLGEDLDAIIGKCLVIKGSYANFNQSNNS